MILFCVCGIVFCVCGIIGICVCVRWCAIIIYNIRYSAFTAPCLVCYYTPDLAIQHYPYDYLLCAITITDCVIHYYYYCAIPLLILTYSH